MIGEAQAQIGAISIKIAIGINIKTGIDTIVTETVIGTKNLCNARRDFVYFEE
jgi:hypothetical protein